MTTDSKQWTANDILSELAHNHLRLQAWGVRSIGLFGSYRRGTPRPDSDIDILVDLVQPSFDSYMDLKFWLEDTFHCAVDLVLIDTLKPRLRPRILDEVVYVEGLSTVFG